MLSTSRLIIKPTGLRAGVPYIDWTDSLTNGLICCYLFGSTSGINLTGLGGNLLPTGSLPWATNADGMGVASTAVTTYFSGSTPSGITSVTNAGSIMWRGSITGAVTTYGNIMGVAYANSFNAPYWAYGMARWNSGSDTLALDWNQGGTAGNVVYTGVIDTSAYGAIYSFTSTYIQGGLASLYVNGQLFGSPASFGAGAIQYGTNSLVIANGDNYFQSPFRALNGTGNIGMVWNRILSPAEVAALHANPYRFLIAPSDLLASMLVGVVPSAGIGVWLYRS